MTPASLTTHLDRFDSPIGKITFSLDPQGGLRGLRVLDSRDGRLSGHGLDCDAIDAPPIPPPAMTVRKQLQEYFAGERRRFDLPVAAEGSPFQRAVWRELTFIPYGETISYGEIADAIGMPGRAQEVGAACAANPVLLVVPCHRVVAADGSLRGFTAGLHVKAQLLAFERGQPALAF